MDWFLRKMGRRLPGEHWTSGVPEGTEIIHNPSHEELDSEVGFPEGSEPRERHGRHFHLIEGDRRIGIEVLHFVERREHGHPDLVEDRTLYVLPEETTLREARRIGYDLLEKARAPGRDPS